MRQFDQAVAAEDRCHFFWWLAEWCLGPADAARLMVLPDCFDGVAVDALDLAWCSLAEAKPAADAGAVQELAVEYTRLFSGSLEGVGPPPPYESVWRENRLMGAATVSVIEAYRMAGFADIDPQVGPQDHLGVELKYVALSSLREAEAWRAGDMASARLRQARLRTFLEDHLAVWQPLWAADLKKKARLPLYPALADLMTAALAQTLHDLTDHEPLGLPAA